MIDDAQRWDLIHQKIHKQNAWHSRYAEEKEKLFPRGALVADLGAGTGADCVYFLKNGHSVVALDISEFALKITQEKAKAAGLSKNLIARQMDFGLHTIPLKENSVDVVYSRISLNYFGRKQTAKLFQDIYRVLKPGGWAYVSLKSPDDTAEMEYLEKSATVYEPNVFIEGGMLRSRFTKDQLTAILQSAQIPNFQVNGYKEDLSGRREGHHSFLFVNEVSFKK